MVSQIWHRHGRSVLVNQLVDVQFPPTDASLASNLQHTDPAADFLQRD
jgi:hypothetical protein